MEWEVERAEDKNSAKRLLTRLTKFIKECLEEMKNDDREEAIDPPVGEYLSAPQPDDQSNREKAEGIHDTINNFKIRVTQINPGPMGTQSREAGNVEIDDDTGDILVDDLPGDGGNGGEKEGRGIGEEGGGHNPGAGGGDSPIEHRKSLVAIAPADIRNLVRNKAEGIYTIVFTPSFSATDGYIDVYMSAESQNYDAAIISASCSDCPGLSVAMNRISNLTFTEKRPLKINIQLDYHDYCPLEVKAYGHKV